MKKYYTLYNDNLNDFLKRIENGHTNCDREMNFETCDIEEMKYHIQNMLRIAPDFDGHVECNEDNGFYLTMVEAIDFLDIQEISKGVITYSDFTITFE